MWLVKFNYFDITVEVCNWFLFTNHYNETNEFRFKVTVLPFVVSCLPHEVSYFVFTAQIIKFEEVINKVH